MTFIENAMPIADIAEVAGRSAAEIGDVYGLASGH
jgi:hypothetical protein